MSFTGLNVLGNGHEPNDQRMQMSLVASILTSTSNSHYVDESDRPYFRAALRTVVGLAKGRKNGNWVELMRRNPMLHDPTSIQSSITFTAEDIQAELVVDIIEFQQGKGRFVQIHVHDYQAEVANERRRPYVLEVDKRAGTVSLINSPHLVEVSF